MVTLGEFEGYSLLVLIGRMSLVFCGLSVAVVILCDLCFRCCVCTYGFILVWRVFALDFGFVGYCLLVLFVYDFG